MMFPWATENPWVDAHEDPSLKFESLHLDDKLWSHAFEAAAARPKLR
jgi:hypothetical protein